MLLNFKSGCIAAGRATSKGGEMTYIGDRGTPKYRFSIQISNERDENGEWRSQYLDCEFFGKAAEAAPDICGGDMVFCAGKLETRVWTGRDGEPRTSTALKCDFAMKQVPGRINNGSGYSPATDGYGQFQELDEAEAEVDLPF